MKGMPFDIDEDDKDYTLDTTVVSDDEDSPFDEEQEEKTLQELEDAKAERKRLLQEGEKTLQEFSTLFGQLKISRLEGREENSRVVTLNKNSALLEMKSKNQN